MSVVSTKKDHIKIAVFLVNVQNKLPWTLLPLQMNKNFLILLTLSDS